MATYLIKNAKDVERVLDLISSYTNDSMLPASRIERLFEEARRKVDSLDLKSLWYDWFLQIGGAVGHLIGANYPRLGSKADFINKLYDKHRLYGAEPLLEWGCIGVVIRLSSKWARYKNHGDTPDETQEDTLRDMLGYAVLGYLVAERTVGKSAGTRH